MEFYAGNNCGWAVSFSPAALVTVLLPELQAQELLCAQVLTSLCLFGRSLLPSLLCIYCYTSVNCPSVSHSEFTKRDLVDWVRSHSTWSTRNGQVSRPGLLRSHGSSYAQPVDGCLWIRPRLPHRIEMARGTGSSHLKSRTHVQSATAISFLRKEQ